MAYVSQDDKKRLSVGIKKVLKKYDVKGSISVRHHFTLCVKIKSGPLDFGAIDDYFGQDVNVYWIETHYKGKAAKFLNELYHEMRGDQWFDESDIQTDYFHVSHYCDIKILPTYQIR